MKNKPKVLIVDDNPEDLKLLSDALKRDFSVLTATSSTEAMKIFSLRPDAVLLDIRLNDADPSNKEGIEVLRTMKSQMPEIPVIMITAYGDIDIAVEAMKLGAVDFIQKQKLNISEIKRILFGVIEKSKLQKKIFELEENLHRLEPWEIIGDDPKILEIKKLIDLVAKDGKITVLVRGETGAGKELVARAIHRRGWRKDGPFVAVAISSLNPSLIESELFGHEKGAFTGADKRKIGFIEKAHTGVLFLDEIGDLNKETQVKLLRFLDHKTFTRVGGTEEITVDIQLVTATNKDLDKAVKEGDFRGDLYYRLKNFQISLPPLRERKDDIPKLAYYFLKLLKSQGRTKIDKISNSAIECLIRYNWPGNVRELKNSIEMAVIYAERNGHSEIMPEDLPFEIRHSSDKHLDKDFKLPDFQDKIDIKRELARSELAYIDRALKKAKGKIIEATKILGYNNRFVLRRRLKIILKKYPELIEEFENIKMVLLKKG